MKEQQAQSILLDNDKLFDADRNSPMRKETPIELVTVTSEWAEKVIYEK